MDIEQNQSCWKLELEELGSGVDSSWVCKFDPSKKKKKKKQPLIRKDDILFQKGKYFAEDNTPLCHNFEPDYGYEELLRRVFGMVGEEDLEVFTERPRTVMMPPQLLEEEEEEEGTYRTVCLNFADLCRTMHRKPDQVMRFLLAQMKTKGLLNKQQQQRLEMNGLVSCKDFQAVLRRYIDPFVICSCCKSPDTALVEDNGLFTLRCEMCGLVASVKEPESPMMNNT